MSTVRYRSYVFRFVEGLERSRPLPTADVYTAFLRDNAARLHLTSSSASIREFRPAATVAFARALRTACKAAKGTKVGALFLELLEPADVRTVDSLAAIVADVLRTKKTAAPTALIFVLAVESCVRESVVVNELLTPAMRDRKVASALVVPSSSGQPTVRWHGQKRPPGRLAPLAWRSEEIEVPVAQSEYLTSEKLETHLDPLVGHFAVGDRASRHFGAVLSLTRVAGRADFVAQVRADAISLVGEPFQIVPIGLDGSATDILAHAVAGKAGREVCYPNRLNDYVRGHGAVLLSEMFPPAFDVTATIAALRSRGAQRIALMSVAKYLGTHHAPADVTLKTYVDLPYYASKADTSDCPFCIQDIVPQVASDLSGFERKVKGFDDFTFWSLVAARSEYVLVGHWESDRTSYHYLFRVITRPLFERHSRGLAVRLRNLLLERGVVPRWIKRIVCTDGEESAMLAEALAAVLQLGPAAVVRIPRSVFMHLTGRVPDANLAPALKRMGFHKALFGKNVIIVDQAAHHFGTLGNLEAICHTCGSEVLAFAVFLDRVGSRISLGDYLAHSHYVSLYSWPSPPRKRHECACLEASIAQ